MREDFVGFTAGRSDKKFYVRPEYIVAFDDATVEDETTIVVEIGNEKDEYNTCEPIDQVKQKIVDAEKVDLSNTTAEHFTKEEYELLLEAVGFFEASCNETKENVEFLKHIEPLTALKYKLNKILKEYK